MTNKEGLNKTALLQLNGLDMKHGNDFLIGLCLALLSSFFIGSSFILKKKGLLKLVANNTSSYALRAGKLFALGVWSFKRSCFFLIFILFELN
jgi:hypothetical protein